MLIFVTFIDYYEVFMSKIISCDNKSRISITNAADNIKNGISVLN